MTSTITPARRQVSLTSNNKHAITKQNPVQSPEKRNSLNGPATTSNPSLSDRTPPLPGIQLDVYCTDPAQLPFEVPRLPELPFEASNNSNPLFIDPLSFWDRPPPGLDPLEQSRNLLVDLGEMTQQTNDMIDSAISVLDNAQEESEALPFEEKVVVREGVLNAKFEHDGRFQEDVRVETFESEGEVKLIVTLKKRKKRRRD
ncbi:hypothetical protein BDV96DRAFT_597054 [Lophiotrema nucula]|uniref:Uncharacterized protein n=1 Tax=Lophiotrema nucula TaxID=690887 RepID=A0A6A5ZH04_9PLEO|nr:hypothetical protein BDV96DRAFT_597054 [Lophiotrema nucula]